MPTRHISLLPRDHREIKARWRRLLGGNVFTRRLAACAKIDALQEATLAEFRSLLDSAASPRWTQRHQTHTRVIRDLGLCGFPVALVYFAAGERAIFGRVARRGAALTKRITDANLLWRFLAQREMQAQCEGCRKVCAIISNFSNSFKPTDNWPRGRDQDAHDR